MDPSIPLLTAQDVADALGVSRRRVYEWAESRDPAVCIPSVKLGRLLRFRQVDVAEYIEQRRLVTR